MAKSTNGGTKGTKKTVAGETKARRAPARRRTDPKTTEMPVAVAADSAAMEQDVGSTPAEMAVVAPQLMNPPADLDPDEIRRRAYQLYLSRGCTNGCDVEDWLEAERQLRNGRTH